MNTEIASNKMEVYTDKLFELADQYINEVLGGNGERLAKRFRELLFYLADRIEKPDNDDIDGLDSLFDAYVRLCVRYNKLPTLEGYSFLSKIHRSTLDDWKNMRYRSSDNRYTDTVKRWYDICKSFVIDELSNNSTVNVNLIFISKSAYGLRETAPVPAPETELRKHIISADEPIRLDIPPTPDEIAARYGVTDTPQLLELPDVPE